MTTDTIDNQLNAVVRRLDPQGRLLRAWSLTGGVSAQVTAFEIARPDGMTQKLIIRRHGACDLEANPRISADEFKLLRRLQAAGLPVPTPYYADESGDIFPTPYLVVEYIEGTTVFAPDNLPDFICQSAATLARIHQVEDAALALSFLPKLDERYTEKLIQRPTVLDDTLDEGSMRDKLESVWPLPQHNQATLLHGDFWPGNLLWRDGRLVAVIDWEDTALGDPLADLGNTRLEILWALGIDAMHTFTHHYQSIMTNVNFTNLPYWDLCAALRPASRIGAWAGDPVIERKMRDGHKHFVTQAFDQLT
jgi:aminoglycoside phosphotransferase (APT) family kinase protein